MIFFNGKLIFDNIKIYNLSVRAIENEFDEIRDAREAGD